MEVSQPVTGNERGLEEGATLVSRTDTQGNITWANRDFLEISGYAEPELRGQPHRIVRHPDMPQALFDNLWHCLHAGQPWVSVLKNRCRNGDHFWVEANVAPMFEGGKVTGYQSVFRKPTPAQIAAAERIFADLRSGRSHYVFHRGVIEPRSLLKDWNPLWHLSLRVRMQMLALVSGGLATLAVFGLQHQIAMRWIWGLIAAGTLFTCYSADWLARDFGGRLRKAVQAFQRIAAGDYHNAVDISRNDEVGGVLLGLQSIQVRLGAEVEELQRSAIQMRRVQRGLDAAATAVLLADERFHVIFANIALQKLFERVEDDLRSELAGFDAHALLGSSLRNFFRNVPGDPLQTLAVQKDMLSQELRLGGHVFNLMMTPVDADDGSRIGYAVEWRDRTDAVAVEAEINAVVKAAAEGDFSRRIELRKSGSNAFFVDLVEGFNRVLDINTRALENIVAVLDALANGDLTRSFDGQYRGTLAKVQEDVNRTLRQLSAIVERIKRASGTIGDAAAQIAAGNTQLSERSEREATNLAETSSNLERLTGTVKQNAEHARQARQLAGTARDVAERGGRAVGDVETTMNAIHQLSQKISDITGVIDGIAFQTNILALNSAVEAARAGEHGRGFAVVASEVRSLAQRAAAAAKEIKQLITTSVEQIANGTQLVGGAGDTMREIIGSVREVDQIMAAIAAASQDQSSGIAQVNAAVAQTDAATRENATLVVEATGSARSLEREAAELGDAVSIFKTADAKRPGQDRPKVVRPLRSARS